jgi:hypothetical protein
MARETLKRKCAAMQLDMMKRRRPTGRATSAVRWIRSVAISPGLTDSAKTLLHRSANQSSTRPNNKYVGGRLRTRIDEMPEALTVMTALRTKTAINARRFAVDDVGESG